MGYNTFPESGLGWYVPLSEEGHKGVHAPFSAETQPPAELEQNSHSALAALHAGLKREVKNNSN